MIACDGKTSHPGVSYNTPRCFKLWKLEISTGLLSHLIFITVKVLYTAESQKWSRNHRSLHLSNFQVVSMLHDLIGSIGRCVLLKANGAW